MAFQVLPLIISSNVENEVHLIVGSNSTNSFKNRVKHIVNSGALPVIVENDYKELKKIELDFNQYIRDSKIKVRAKGFELSDLTTNGRVVVNKIVDRVFVYEEDINVIEAIHKQCIKLRIPICCFQKPEYSTFNLMSTYTDPKKSGLQISVTTNGQGCLLANRIKREVINSLPENISEVVSNMGQLRNTIIKEDKLSNIISLAANKNTGSLNNNFLNYGLSTDEDFWDSYKFNGFIKEFQLNETDQKLKRSRWLSQIMEYYPLNKLSDVRLEDLNEDSKSIQTSLAENNTDEPHISNKRLKLGAKAAVVVAENAKKGSISLVGSGPGSVSMLTLGALNEIKSADFILADKLVPQPIIDLIPKEADVFFARKFPGNAEHAQQELLQKGIIALKEGKKVIRLKQGDPYIFGRGGEEYLFFEKEGFTPFVFPGISSALAATVVAEIPATQRDVADQILICTGTGKKGSLPVVPEYVESRTTVFLMALHRAEFLTTALLEKSWNPNVPIAIVERASCKDQRITRTLLKYLPEVIKEIGSRPPGLLVTGKAVNALVNTDITEHKKYIIDEGYRESQIDLSNLV